MAHNIQRDRVCIEEKTKVSTIIGEESSRWWTWNFFVKWAQRLDYIAFYIRFLLRTKTRLFDEDACLNVGHYFCMSSVQTDGMMERISRESEQKYHWNNNCLSSSSAGLLAFHDDTTKTLPRAEIHSL